MNRLAFTFVVTLSVAVCYQDVHSQKKNLTEDEFNQVYNEAKIKLDSTTYRISTVGQVSSSTRPIVQRTFQVVEFMPPDKRRRAVLSGGFSGKPTFERIWFNQRYFERADGGAWIETIERLQTDLPGSGRVDRKEFLFLERTNLKNEQADVLEVRETGTNISTDGMSSRYSRKTRYWFSTDGRFLKSVRQIDVGNGSFRVTEESVYEYEPSGLSIEVPIK